MLTTQDGSRIPVNSDDEGVVRIKNVIARTVVEALRDPSPRVREAVLNLLVSPVTRERLLACVPPEFSLARAIVPFIGDVGHLWVRAELVLRDMLPHAPDVAEVIRGLRNHPIAELASRACWILDDWHGTEDSRCVLLSAASDAQFEENYDLAATKALRAFAIADTHPYFEGDPAGKVRELSDELPQRSGACISAGRAREAIQWIESVAAIAPRALAPDTLFNLACAHARCGDANAAAAALARAIALEPRQADDAREDDDLALILDEPAMRALLG
jgi:tetratricopeptide (TPR) repeat protein